MWLAFWFFMSKFGPTDAAVRRQFGNMFGAINALFSAFAFAGLIFAILLQREDLALQREELVETREELRRSATAQEASHKALQEQIRTMRHGALISAVDTLIRTYDEQLATVRSDPEAHMRPQFNQLMSKRAQYLEMLEHLVAASGRNGE
jgi:hypothetical protein